MMPATEVKNPLIFLKGFMLHLFVLLRSVFAAHPRSLPLVAIFCCMLFPAIAISQIEVDFTADRKEVQWGGNVEFSVKIKNTSGSRVSIHGLRFGGSRPTLKLVSGNSAESVVRDVNSSGRIIYGSQPTVLKPDEIYEGKFLLNYGAQSIGNLPVGEHELSVVGIGSIPDGDTYQPLKLPEKETIRLKVVDPGHENKKLWLNYLKNQNFNSLSRSSRAKTLGSFVEDNPSVSMEPTLRFDIIKTLVASSKVHEGPDFEAIEKAIMHLNALYENPMIPDLLKRMACKRILELVENKPGYEKFKEAISGKLNQLNSEK